MKMNLLKKLFERSSKLLVAGGLLAFVPTLSYAQICGPAYSVQSQTVMDVQEEQRWRVVYDTVNVEQQIVTNRAVPKTRMETRQRTVSKPVVETSTIEERYTVLKPVTTREYVDQSYDETTYVTETAEREETRTSLRPVTETQYQTQNYVVQRPVTETQYQTQQYTTYQPVTTYQNAVVDQGQYYVQQYQQPGDTRYGLRYLPGGYGLDPTGQGAYRRGGFGWVPYTSPGQTFAQLQYQPNPVQVAVPQTTLMPQVQQAQVPVQVTKMQSELVQQQVPVTVMRYETVQQTYKVPYAVQKPVVRRIERKIPVDKTQYVEQEMIRPKTVQRTSYKYETVTEQVPVTVYETEAVTTTVLVPRRVARYEPYTVRRMVPRVVQSPVISTYSDPYAYPLSLGHSSWMPSTNASSESVTFGEGRPADSTATESSGGQSVKKIEMEEIKVPPQGPMDEEPSKGELELSPSDADKPQA